MRRIRTPRREALSVDRTEGDASNDAMEEAQSASPTFDEVFPTHIDYVKGSLRRMGVMQSDVPDLCQEVLIAVHRKLPSFEGRAELRSWIWAICWRTASTYRRSSYRSREVSLGAFEIADQCVEPERAIYYGQCWRHVDRAIEALPVEQQRVFRMRFSGTMTMREIAADLNCNLQTAFSRLTAACRAAEFAVKNLGD